MWILNHLIICYGSFLIIMAAYYVPKKYLKRDYPEYANPSYPRNPQPNPIPSATRQLFTLIYFSMPALCAAFFLTIIISDESNYGRSFFVLAALMLPAMWHSIEMYFSDIKKRRAMRLLDTMPREHLIGIVISFLKEHPEKLNEPCINLIIEDLHQAFPAL